MDNSITIFWESKQVETHTSETHLNADEYYLVKVFWVIIFLWLQKKIRRSKMKVSFHLQKLKVFHLVCLISLMQTQVVAQTQRKSFAGKTFSNFDRNMCNNIISNRNNNNNNINNVSNYNKNNINYVNNFSNIISKRINHVNDLSINNDNINNEGKVLKVVERSADQAGKHPDEASPPAVLYLPLGGSGRPSCLPSAGSKLAQLVSSFSRWLNFFEQLIINFNYIINYLYSILL